MLLKIIGVLIAAAILIFQELIKDKIKKKWIKFSLITLVVLSLFFSIFQFYLDEIDQKNLIDEKKTIAKQNKELIEQVNKIEIKNDELEKQNEVLIIKVDSNNILLKPFIETARKKYPSYDISAALNLLLNEISTVKNMVSTSKIEKVSKSITKVKTGYQIELGFKMTNNNIRDKVIFDVFLPIKSKAKILSAEPYAVTLALFNNNSVISADRKSAHLEFNIAGSQIPNLRINLDLLDQILVKSNYLVNDLEIK